MEEQTLHIVVPEGKKKQRLDTYLTGCLSDVSRSRIQRLIEEGYVTVDGERVKPRFSVLPCQKIQVRLPRPPPQEARPEDIPLVVVYEDEYLLVIDKPAGMVVHPAVGNRSGTLVNALLGRGTSLAEAGDPLRPGIVHRLDKDTSGLLVVAKNATVHAKLAAQFAEKSVRRCYRALVWGRISRAEGRIETEIGRSVRDRKKMAVRAGGKRAVTTFRVRERFSFCTYLYLVLETGRTHQIRVHMNHVGHPVFGDPAYGGRGSARAGLKREHMQLARELLERMPRQALHAGLLGFVHPETGERLSFESELPEDFRGLLERLREEKNLS